MWATFDCYGTLIDWNGGIGRELERLFGTERAGTLLHAYHELEPQVQREDPTRSYRDVLTITLARLAEQQGLDLPDDEQESLADSLPTWRPFPDVRASLEDVRARGWRLAILSNTDRDYIDASLRLIGVPFDHVIVASEIGSYKPAHRHWEVFREEAGDPGVHVHVAASLFHDIAPAVELGLPTIWINRLGEEPEPQPDVELRSLEGLGVALDALA
ncbi:MAG: 2-haloacid dehalogenase [Gaiellaceae bacterium]|jgi:2-haloacid dehalogenase|nr:2-haloacid dehalogenase [Gaiellaceae bacterium]MDX6469872.1 2-haloacid dehalogenase [Gaiellaceae bacterium]